ncbi:uncharacterized protein BJ171DRAFT_608953 [Polychytrium aggregatum]|uniref:uncharacterized protein n=1 Tax=Polychytrium aggregatum TaxID=110093 RepID=UPI0022FDED4C|nr:uncharacterized protein BJ171DRAFT_608953 [Polychytrium aggregatum]KAI9209685.1 hypothetical protein BJ171DRAFT_608953 [Polychytrium aggregatum]
MPASDTQKKLSLAICDFLRTSIENGTISSDDAEGIEVAIQCIGEAFGVNPDEGNSAYSIKPQNLASIFEVFLNTQKKVSSGPKPQASAEPRLSDEERKAQAESFKAQGNKKMAEKDYAESISLYTKAIELDSRSAVYYGNRAAAYSQDGQHELAVADAKKAIEIDPNWAKGYSRLGHALFCLEQYEEAVAAYEKGLELDPNNASMQTSLNASKAKVNANADARGQAANRDLDNAGSSASSSAGAGAGGLPDLSALGGMDLGSIMSNPMFMSMAQNLMKDPKMAAMAQNLMSNPDALKEMMNNPEVASAAAKMMGGRK